MSVIVLPFLPALIGLAGTIGLAAAFSIILKPLGLLAGAFSAFFMFLYLSNRLDEDLFSKGWMNDVVYTALSVITGYVIYRIFAAGILFIGSLVVVTVVVTYFFGSVKSLVDVVLQLADR